jgi:acyl carrier protein
VRNTATGPGEPVTAQDSAEHLVLELCREVLRWPEATLEDRFTEIGGTSLMASQLLVLIQEHAGVRISAPALLRAPDLRAVARLLTAADTS